MRNALGTTTLSEFNSIIHDGAGNRLSVTANLPTVPSFSGTTTYQYDAKDQLTQETSSQAGTYTNGFGYNAAGNPTTFKGVGKQPHLATNCRRRLYSRENDGHTDSGNGGDTCDSPGLEPGLAG